MGLFTSYDIYWHETRISIFHVIGDEDSLSVVVNEVPVNSGPVFEAVKAYIFAPDRKGYANLELDEFLDKLLGAPDG